MDKNESRTYKGVGISCGKVSGKIKFFKGERTGKGIGKAGA